MSELYTEDHARRVASRFQDALDVQDACNPSGVAKLFYDSACAFMHSPEYKGTDSVKRDPALRLMAYKLCELMGICATLERAYDDAFAECNARIGQAIAHKRRETMLREQEDSDNDEA